MAMNRLPSSKIETVRERWLLQKQKQKKQFLKEKKN